MFSKCEKYPSCNSDFCCDGFWRRRTPQRLNFAFVAAVTFAPGDLPYSGHPLEHKDNVSGLSSIAFVLPLLSSAMPLTAPFLIAGGNYEKAIECAKTYLLFFPHDEVMNQNLAYYTAVLGENLARPIQPREVSNQMERMIAGTSSLLTGDLCRSCRVSSSY